MLISPTEPLPLRQLGKTSSLPEKYGVDFLFPSKSGMIGVQRKEVNDLIASVQNDGRLARELAMMRKLDIGVVLIEGNPNWTTDGWLVSRQRWSKKSHQGVVMSVQSQGYWVLNSDGMVGTIEVLKQLQDWGAKDSHNGLMTRPKMSNQWGVRGNRDWAVHILQGFDGVGVELAGRIYDMYGLPLQWTIREGEFEMVEGIGRVKAEKLVGMLKMEKEGKK